MAFAFPFLLPQASKFFLFLLLISSIFDTSLMLTSSHSHTRKNRLGSHVVPVSVPLTNHRTWSLLSSSFPPTNLIQVDHPGWIMLHNSVLLSVRPYCTDDTNPYFPLKSSLPCPSLCFFLHLGAAYLLLLCQDLFRLPDSKGPTYCHFLRRGQESACVPSPIIPLDESRFIDSALRADPKYLCLEK